MKNMFSTKDRVFDILWSPFNSDEFLVYGNDLNLYKITSTKPKNVDLQLSDEYYAELIANYSDNTNSRLVSWYHGHENQHLFALSYSNKIDLISLSTINAVSKQIFEVKKVIAFKQTRQCNNIVWNPIKSNYLAGGFDRTRHENSVIVWDTTKASGSNDSSSELAQIFSLTSELCNSLSWHPNDENLLLCGINNNSLKMYDIRNSTKYVKSASTKYVFNFCIDPTTSNQAASFHENQIAIWDLRHFDTPCHIINEIDPLVKIQWSKSKCGRLASLIKNSNEISLHNIRPLVANTKNSESGQRQVYVDRTDRVQSTLQKKTQTIPNGSYLRVFCWSNDTNRMLIMNNAQTQNLKMLTLTELTAMTWSPNDSSFYWSSNLGFIKKIDCIDSNDYDFTGELKERTKSDYGLKYKVTSEGVICDFLSNRTICSISSLKHELTYVWYWFECSFNLFEDQNRYDGLRVMLETLIKRGNFSESIVNKFRSITYELCGWDHKNGVLMKQFFIKLETERQSERAICLAVLLNHTEYALEYILEKASNEDNRLGCLWIALKSFTEHFNKPKSPNSTTDSPLPSNFSINECLNLVEGFSNPYLRALFSYVILGEKAITTILNDKNIIFQDRVALAVYFLFSSTNYGQLESYFDSLITESVKNANIHAIVLTGLSTKCVELFQAYIDKTGDIQSIVLMVIHSTSAEVIQHKQVRYWIECYRELLNKWKLWDKRAEFDIFKMKLEKYNHPHLHITNQQQRKESYSQVVARTQDHHSTQTQTQNYLYSQIMHCNNCGKSVLERPLNRSYTSSNLGLLSSHIHSSETISQVTISRPRYTASLRDTQHFGLNEDEDGEKLENDDDNEHNGVDHEETTTNRTEERSLDHKSSNDSIQGCSSCRNFLPQCTICLKYMNINLHPDNTLLIRTSESYLHNRHSIAGYPSPQVVGLTVNHRTPLIPNTYNLGNLHPLVFTMPLNTTNSIENQAFAYNTKFGNWFSWCLNCKHGGHIKHLLEWFSKHTKCSFPHCKCTCISLDSVINK